MSEEPFTVEIKVDEVAYLTCNKCGQPRMCAHLASTTVIKEEYDQPHYSLALCSRCLRTLARRVAACPTSPPGASVSGPDVDDDMEDSNG